MEADSWSYLSAASKRHLPAALQSQLDAYLVLVESDGAEDESGMEYACPFCPQDFDIVGFCCHIEDEHQVESKSGVCPLCAAKVGFNLVSHLTMQHASFFKISFLIVMYCNFLGLQKFLVELVTSLARSLLKSGTLHPLRTQFGETCFLSSLINSYMERRKRSYKGSSESHTILSLLKKDLLDANLQSFSDGSSFLPDNTTPDPLLSSFILNVPAFEALNDAQLQSLDEESAVDKQLNDKVAESVEIHKPDKDHKERALRSEFVRGLVLSTIFEEDSY